MRWADLGIIEFTTAAEAQRSIRYEDARPRCIVTTPAGEVLQLPTFFNGIGFSARARWSGPGTYRACFVDGAQTVDESEVEVGSSTPVAPLSVDTDLAVLRRGDSNEPVLWLADTWWFVLSTRVSDVDLKSLIRLRRAQGFNVVQLVAGLYPEASAGDVLSESDGRWSWTPDLSALDHRWWAAADERIAAIVDGGLTPAIVGAWSYYLLDLGECRIRAHWAEAIARWASLPVVWCIAGEAGLPHYSQLTDPDLDVHVQQLVDGWTEIGEFVRSYDPFANPVTMHPCPAFGHYSSLDAVADPSVVDLVWLQTGHADRGSVPASLDALERVRCDAPSVPVINSEVCYEGIAGGSASTLQRFLFWTHVLSGAAGHTYGAQGLWGFAVPGEPSPGEIWGRVGWLEASQLDGARQVGIGASLLRDQAWWTLNPRNDLIIPHADNQHRFLPYCAGNSTRVIAYIPAVSLLPPTIGISLELRDVQLRDLEAGPWTFDVVDPKSGEIAITYDVTIAADGSWSMPTRGAPTPFPTMEDWLLIGNRVVG